MSIVDVLLTAAQVRHDVLYLFLGAAFTTVGIVAGAFGLFRHKVDALLLWFALLVIAYGQRLWLQTGTVTLIIPHSVFFVSFQTAINYLIPIPAAFYFQAAGFLSRFGKQLTYALTAFFLALFTITIIAGPMRVLQRANNVVVIGIFCMLALRFLRTPTGDRDLIMVRRGLLVFAAFALSDNIAGITGHYPFTEPVGFVFFLSALGIVAARRSSRRDQALYEVQKELEVARRIQMAILPGAYPESSVFRVASRYVPMSSVAGDFYDYLVAEEQRAGLLVADVSGHGVPAALIASMVKLSASSQKAHAADPAALLNEMNAALCGNTQSQFVTAAYVYLDAESSVLRYAAAAHPPMLLLRNGKITEITENGLMLAAFPFATYTAATHPLLPGDRIVLYTDGVLEATDGRQQEFGQARLQQLVCEQEKASPEELAALIMRTVQQWSLMQEDDLTVVVCDYMPHRTSQTILQVETAR